jgi:hypothetical protein
MIISLNKKYRLYNYNILYVQNYKYKLAIHNFILMIDTFHMHGVHVLSNKIFT